MSSQVFPRRNLPESSEDWGRKVEDQIRELSKENTLIKSTLSNLNRTMSGVGSALSATRRQTAFATKSAQAAAEGVQTVWDEVHNPSRKEEQGIPLDSLAGWRAFYEDWTLADVALENGILSLEAPEDQGLYILSPPLDVTGGDWRVAVDVRAVDESTSGTVELGTFPVEENGEFTSLVSHEFVPADPWTPPEDDDIDPEPYESPTEWVSLAGTVTVEGPQQLSLALYIPPGVTYEAREEVPGESEGEDPTVVVSTRPAPLEWRRFGMYEVTALEEARKVLAQMAQEAAEHAQQALDTLAQLEPRLDDAEQDLFDAIIDFEQKRSALEAVVNTIGQTADMATQNAQQAHNTAVEAWEKALASASSGGSLILNGGFEQGLAEWGGDGELTTPGHTGDNALKLTPESSAHQTQAIPTSEGRVYLIGGWVKRLSGASTAGGSFTAEVSSPTSTETVNTGNVLEYVSSEWTKVSGKVTVALEDATELKFGLTLGAGDSVVAWDGLFAVDVTEAEAALAAAEEARSRATAAEQAVAAAVVGSEVEYAKNLSPTDPPTTGWEESQTYTEGSYIWQRTKVTYGDGSEVYTPPVLMTGNTGPSGDSLYTWFKYADTPTTGMSNSPVGKSYIGIAYNQPTATPSSDYGDYEWTLFKGDPGDSGDTLYTWVKYAVSDTGAGMSDDPEGKDYIGLAFNKTSAVASDFASDYTWSLIKGAVGDPGSDGKSLYTWVKYAPNGSPTNAQITDLPQSNSTHIGLAYNKTTATESTSASAYTWTLIQGPKGDEGDKGDQGVSVTSVTPHFRRLAESATKPAKPSGMTPSGWVGVEPDYARDTTMWRSDRIVFSNGQITWTDVSKSSSYEAAKEAESAALAKADAVTSWVQSRGTDLVTNGTGYLGDNTNFSGFDFDPTDGPVGTRGAFVSRPRNGGGFTDELIPVDPSKKYVMSYFAIQRDPDGVGARHYACILPYDSTGQSMSPKNYMYRPDTLTTLAQPLNDGDTYATLTDVPGAWSVGAFTYLGVWNYADDHGKVWPVGTYTRTAPRYDSIQGNQVHFRGVYRGPSYPAGTPVSNNGSGNSYMYPVLNVIVPTEWTAFTGLTVTGVHSTPASVATTAFPPGTAAVKIGFMYNRGVSPSEHAFAGISFSDTTAVQIDADEARALATTADGKADTAISDASTAVQRANAAVKDTKIEYAVNTSETVAPTSGWSTATPTRTPGSFIWMRTTITYGSGNTTTTEPALLTGNAGATGPRGPQGLPGNKGADGTQYYTWLKYAPNGNPTSAQMTDVPNSDSTHMGLALNQTSPTEGTDPSAYTWSLIKGDPGVEGVSVESITPFFQRTPKSSSAPANPGGVATPPEPWTETEPSYVVDTALWRTDRVVYSDGSVSYTTVTRVTAYDVAAQAMLSASGKNSIIRSTFDASGSVHPQTGQPNVEGDEWWKLNVLNAAGRTVGRWQWDGSTWVPVKISHEVIDSVDVNQLKVHGTAAIDTAVIEKFWAEMAHIVKLTANQILVHPGNEFPDPYFEDTAGWTGDGVALIQDASVPGNVLQITGTTTVRGSYYHDLTDAGKTMALRPGDKYRVTLRRKSSVLARDIEMRLISSGDTTQTTIPRNSVADTWEEVSFEITAPTGVGKALPSFHTRTTLGSGVIQIADVRVTSMVDGTLITPGSITSPHLNITDTAWMSDAVIGDLVGRTAFLEYLNALDILARRVLVHDGDGGVTVALGVDDEQVIQIPAADGGIGAAIDNNGGVSGRTVSATSSLLYRGTELDELLNRGSVVAFTDVFIPTVSTVLSSWLRLLTVEFVAEPSHIYSLHLHGLRVGGTQSTWQAQLGVFQLRSGDTTPAAGLPPLVSTDLIYATGSSHTQDRAESVEPEFTWVPNPQGGPKHIKATVAIRRSASTGYVTYEGGYGAVMVVDHGPRAVTAATGHWEAATPTVAPKIAVTRTLLWYSNGFASYTGAGARNSSGPAGSNAMQGYSPYWPAGGQQKSILLFPAGGIKTALAGATINNVRLRLTTPHWHSSAGGTARIHTHNYTAAPGSSPTQTFRADVDFGRGQTRWIRFGAYLGEGFRDGTIAGVGFDTQGSASTQYYGYVTPAGANDVRPAIEITFTRME